MIMDSNARLAIYLTEYSKLFARGCGRPRRRSLQRRFGVEILEGRRLLCADHLTDDTFGTYPAEDVRLTPASSGQSPSTVAAPARSASGDVKPPVPVHNSLVGAAVTLYLDFDGRDAMHWTSNSRGSGGYEVPETPPYTIDAPTDSFSATERANIDVIWSIVAEKFSPFDVNVTTVEPGLFPPSATIVIGGDGAWHKGGGGVAYQNGYVTQRSPIGWVWAHQDNVDYVGEAVAHEAGHLFGLEHRSTTAPFPSTQIVTEYAPGWIMGSGGDTRPGRWGVGTSSVRTDDALLYNGVQDDLQIMTNGGGLRFRSDDHGGDTAHATPMSVSGNSRTASGIIERPADRDVFSFTTTGGTLRLDVKASSDQFYNFENGVTRLLGSMLDATIDLIGPGGGTTTIDTASLGETYTSPSVLPAGTYYVVVRPKASVGDLGQYSVNVALNEQFDNTMNTAQPLGRFGQTSGSFGLLNPLYAGRGEVSDFVGDADAEDYYYIRPESRRGALAIWLHGLGEDADVQLIDDANGNGRLDSGEIIGSGTRQGSLDELFVTHLSADRGYYIRVFRFVNANTNYTLTLTHDGAGNGLIEGNYLPPRAIGELGGVQTFNDWLEPVDADDFYAVNMAATGKLEVTLAGVSGDMDLELIRDANGNNSIDAGEVVSWSRTAGSASESLAPVVAAGRYYIRAYAVGQTFSNYTLTTHADYAYNLFVFPIGPVPKPRDLGTLDGSVVRAVDYVGSRDGNDYYQFYAAPGMLRLRAIGPHAFDLLGATNSSGALSGVASGKTINYVVPNANGDGSPVLHQIIVSRTGGEFPSDGNYSFSLQGTPPAPADDAPASGVGITPQGAPSSTTGYVGYTPSQPDLGDPQDFYRFTVGGVGRQRFTASIVSATAGGGPVHAGVQLIRDANNNGVVDPGERLAGDGMFATFNPATSIDYNVAPGNYLLRVFTIQPERGTEDITANYRLTYALSNALVDATRPGLLGATFDYDGLLPGLKLQFSEDVSLTLDTSDMVLVNIDTNATVPLSELVFNRSTNVADLSFAQASSSGVLPDGRYRLTMQSTSGVTDLSGNDFAGPFTYSFVVLAGDADQDHDVDFADLLVLARNYNKAGRTFSQGNFNYSADGSVSFDDLLILAKHYNTSILPATASASTTVAEGNSAHRRLSLDVVG